MNEQTSGWRPQRREFLKCLPLAAVWSAGTLSGSPSDPSMQFPNDARSRLAVTSYPFRSRIVSATNHARKTSIPGMDLKEFPAFVAGNFNIFNINPLLDHFSATDDAYVDAFRVAIDKAHSRIVDLGLGGRRFYAKEESVRRDAVSFGRKCVDIAVKVGSPSVRQHVAGQVGEKADIMLAASSLGEMAEYAARKNIVINLENDSAVAEDPFFLVAVIEKVSNPYLRALPDFGNSLMGHDQRFNQAGVKAMLEHAFNMCHVKDAVEGEDGRIYKVDLAPLFELAKASSYRGFFSMEFDTAIGDAMEGTRHLVEKTLQYLG